VADAFHATMSFMKQRKRKKEAQMRAKRAYSPAQEEARRWAESCGFGVGCAVFGYLLRFFDTDSCRQ
jgi:hypothetical protein